MGFVEFLTLILVIAKLTGHFAHPWIWVFAPCLTAYAIVFLIFVLARIGIYKTS